jgi:hypothetical protein
MNIFGFLIEVEDRLIFFARRKSRCSGTLPCKRCTDFSIPCKYETPHRRGQPACPPRDTSVITRDNSLDPPIPEVRQQPLLNVPDQKLPNLLSNSRPGAIPNETENSLRSSPGRGAAVLEGQYIGPTSGLTFLHRAKSRLRQDFSFSPSNGADTPRAPSSIFNYGDKPFPSSSGMEIVLPDRQQAREQVKRYFEFAIPTYRFLHQGTVEDWLEKLMDESATINTRRKALTAKLLWS